MTARVVKWTARGDNARWERALEEWSIRAGQFKRDEVIPALHPKSAHEVAAALKREA
jgi:hypothetical protein